MQGKALILAVIMAMVNLFGAGYVSARVPPASVGDQAPAVADRVYDVPTVPDEAYEPQLPPPSNPAPPAPLPSKPLPPRPVPPGTQPVFPKSIVVIDVGEGKAVSVKKSPDAKSKNVGRVYGSLTGVKVLQYGKPYSLIEARDYGSSRMIKGYVATRLLRTIKPRQDWGIVVDLSKQRLYVYKKGKEVKAYPVSTGKSAGGRGTPAGTYIIGSRGKVFRLENGVGAWNWVRFNNDYLFHSVIFDKNNKVIASEAKKLGQEASHGCIRMPLEESKWFYANVPRNTPVLIVGKIIQDSAEPVEIKVLINNRLQIYRQQPIELKGSIYVPLRDFAEGLGAQVNWDAAGQTVKITRSGQQLFVKVNERAAVIDGVQVQMEQPVLMVKDTCMAPVRFLGESLGAAVGWEGAKNTVIITYA